MFIQLSIDSKHGTFESYSNSIMFANSYCIFINADFEGGFKLRTSHQNGPIENKVWKIEFA